MAQAKVIKVKAEAKQNETFRTVLFTAEKSQLVMMSLRPGEDIGEEVHADVDQLLYAVRGEGVAVADGKELAFDKGTVFCVPAGVKHNVKNTGDEPMKLFTVYAPPQHAPGTVHETKADAAKAEKAETPVA